MTSLDSASGMLAAEAFSRFDDVAGCDGVAGADALGEPSFLRGSMPEAFLELLGQQHRATQPGGELRVTHRDGDLMVCRHLDTEHGAGESPICTVDQRCLVMAHVERGKALQEPPSYAHFVRYGGVKDAASGDVHAVLSVIYVPRPVRPLPRSAASS